MAQLFGKYNVTKANGEPTDPNAQYFVLRIDTDPAAMMALGFYAAVQPDLEFREQLQQWMQSIEAQKTPDTAPSKLYAYYRPRETWELIGEFTDRDEAEKQVMQKVGSLGLRCLFRWSKADEYACGDEPQYVRGKLLSEPMA